MPAVRIQFAFLPLFAAAAIAQKTVTLTTPERTRLEISLKRLDLEYTDWVLLLDVGEKAAALAPAATAVVADTATAAKGRGDGRFYLRLLGVLARLDPEQGTARLAEAIASSEQAKAALAARVLGRSGAPAERVATVIGVRLQQEKRKGMAGAMALCAADAGATGLVKVLRERLTNSRLDRSSQMAVATALGQLLGPEAKKEATGWLKADSPLLPTAILLARRWHDGKAEPALLALHAATTDDRDLAQWLAETLGAIGGDATRKAFRTALDAEARGEADPGIAAMSSDLDPRLLALLRLHEDKATGAVRGLIGGAAAGGRATPAVARLAELFGKWNAPGAIDLLAEIAADESAPPLVRAHAARGLCWRRELRGLEAAAAILAAKEHKANEFGVAEGLTMAQQALHEFVANGDRPDYVPIDRGNEAAATAIGEAWQPWLQEHASKVTWREPPPNVDELLFWVLNCGGKMTARDRLRWLSRQVSALARRLEPVAPLLTRLVIGYAFVVTGWGKLTHFAQTVAFFDEVGIWLTPASAAFVAALELVGGVMLCLGLGTRIIAALLSFTMCTAALTADRARVLGAFAPDADYGPIEVAPLLFLLFLLWLVADGGGLVSLDRLLARARPVIGEEAARLVQQRSAAARQP